MFQQNKIKQLKFLASSIAHETKNPLSAIKQSCSIIKDNLNQAMEFIDLIEISSSRGLLVTDMILQNIREGKINQDNFINLSISEIIKSSIKEFSGLLI